MHWGHKASPTMGWRGWLLSGVEEAAEVFQRQGGGAWPGQKQEPGASFHPPVYSGNTDSKRLHFSTVCVVVLWGAGPAFQGQTTSSPVPASNRKLHVFNVRSLPNTVSRAQGLLQLRSHDGTPGALLPTVLAMACWQQSWPSCVLANSVLWLLAPHQAALPSSRTGGETEARAS